MKVSIAPRLLLTLLAALGVVLCGAGWSQAASITYTITDAGTFTNYEATNTADTFTGTGFVGIYPTFATDVGTAGPAFAHLLGLENYNGIYSETELQVGLSALAGATISSATLSYNLLNGATGSQQVTVTSFTDATGKLAFNITPPNNLGSTTFTSNGLSSNSVNVTALVQAAATASSNWLGLYLTPNGPGDISQYTYTYAGYGGTLDAATVRLTVNYTTAATPEPCSILLLGSGLAGLAAFRKKFKA